MGNLQDRRKNGGLEKARQEKSVIVFYCEGMVEGEDGGERKE